MKFNPKWHMSASQSNEDRSESPVAQTSSLSPQVQPAPFGLGVVLKFIYDAAGMRNLILSIQFFRSCPCRRRFGADWLLLAVLLWFRPALLIG